MTVATDDVDGDGFADKITSPVTIDTHPSDPSEVASVILKNIVVTSVSSPTGACKATWDIKKNEK